MMTTSLLPGEAPVSLEEARRWLRMGAAIDDDVVTGLIGAATNICEAFVGQWLVVRGAEEILPIGSGALRLAVRPVVAVDTVTLMIEGGGETALAAEDYRVTIGRDGDARLTIHRPGAAARVRVGYRAGMAPGPGGVPDAIRQGIMRMIQYLHDARGDGSGGDAPPAMIAALWHPWRRLMLGSAR